MFPSSSLSNSLFKEESQWFSINLRHALALWRYRRSLRDSLGRSTVSPYPAIGAGVAWLPAHWRGRATKLRGSTAALHNVHLPHILTLFFQPTPVCFISASSKIIPFSLVPSKPAQCTTRDLPPVVSPDMELCGNWKSAHLGKHIQASYHISLSVWFALPFLVWASLIAIAPSRIPYLNDYQCFEFLAILCTAPPPIITGNVSCQHFFCPHWFL